MKTRFQAEITKIDGALSGRVCEHNWVLDGHHAGDPVCSKCYARS